MGGRTRPDGRADRSWRRVLPWLAMAAVPWAVTRVAVLGVLGVAHEVVTHAHPDAAAVARVHQGLLGWDAGWYQAIAAHGYGGAGHLSLRFWPLLPLLGRAVAMVPGISPGAGLLVVTEGAQLVGMALVACLVAQESGDRALARRTVWLLALVPAAFVSVMGYAEPVLLVASAGALLALRRRRWWLAAFAGLGAGLCRPLGIALALPAAIEVSRPWWEPRWRGRRHPDGARTNGSDHGETVAIAVARGSRGWLAAAGGTVGRLAAAGDRGGRPAAVLGPLVGFGAFLGWCAWRYHDGLAPLRIQQQPKLHGHLADPFVTIAHDLSGLLAGHHLDEGLHVPWVALAVVLLVVAAVRLPSCYTAFAAVVLVAAVSGPNLDSFERYALSAFPLVWAGALLTASPRVERAVLTLGAAGLAGYALLAFLNVLVP